jgi:hypothetical protein
LAVRSIICAEGKVSGADTLTIAGFTIARFNLIPRETESNRWHAHTLYKHPSVGIPADAVQTIDNARLWAKTNVNGLDDFAVVSNVTAITPSIRKLLPFPELRL